MSEERIKQLEEENARLIREVRELTEKQVSVPLMAALQSWLDTMEKRSINSITKADERLSRVLSGWLTERKL